MCDDQINNVGFDDFVVDDNLHNNIMILIRST